VTFVTQMIDHIGRVFPDVRIDCCGTTNVAIVANAEYGMTDRWSISGNIPYVFAKYRGGPPDGAAAFLPYPAVDSCHCVHSSFQDFGFGTQYNLLRVRRSFSLTASTRYGVPSHGYDYAGEAVVGFGLKELGLGLDAGWVLAHRVSIESSYAYTFVERALGISHNRSNVRLDAGYAFRNRLEAHGIMSVQRTHGGLRFPDDVQPYPERWTEFHRLLNDDYVQAGGGASYPLGNWDLSFSFLKTLSGDNTHNVHVYTVETSRSFRLGR